MRWSRCLAQIFLSITLVFAAGPALTQPGMDMDMPQGYVPNPFDPWPEWRRPPLPEVMEFDRAYILCLLRPELCGSPAGCPVHSSPPPQAPVAGGSQVAYQQFPSSGALRTAWYITYDHGPAKGLYITGAYFKPAPNRSWIKVLHRAGLSELFVPYQSGSPRYLDLSTFNFDLVTATSADAGRCGRIVGRDGKVIREVVDKGPLWKNDQQVYRGQKLLLWGTLDAANYNYIIQYAFHDDGSIEFRTAATAENLPGKRYEAHMHNSLWRVDIDLNGAGGDSVFLTRHLEPTSSPSWTDTHVPFNGHREGAVDFSASEFTTLHVSDATLKNANGKQTAYEIKPLVRGVARHMEPWMRNDFWVTRYKATELQFKNIITYSNNEPTDNTDIVVWVNAPILHIPRDEDGRIENSYWVGVAIAMWGGFDMKPHNLFERTPFYPAP
jgi:primary-amine oxidase